MQSWFTNSGENPFLLWRDSLLRCKVALLAWSKTRFPNNKKRIESLNHDLKLLQAGPFYSNYRRLESAIIDELALVWSYEESFWKQRSRINWLLNGDRNSKIFHLSTLQR